MPRSQSTTRPTGQLWGYYSSTSELPNVSGSATQVPDLDIGDLACVSSGSNVAIYVCTVPAQSAATWSEIPYAGEAASGALEASTTVTAGTAVVAGTTVTAGTGITSTTGDIVATAGDLNAGGGHRVLLGPFKVTLAAGQSATAVPQLPSIAVAFTTLRAGSITAIRGNVDAAITGASQQVNAFVLIAGSRVAASQMDFTQAGAETTALVTPGKDAAGYTFTAGQTITVDYDSDTITNTPELEVWVEIEQ